MGQTLESTLESTMELERTLESTVELGDGVSPQMHLVVVEQFPYDTTQDLGRSAQISMQIDLDSARFSKISLRWARLVDELNTMFSALRIQYDLQNRHKEDAIPRATVIRRQSRVISIVCSLYRVRIIIMIWRGIALQGRDTTCNAI